MSKKKFNFKTFIKDILSGALMGIGVAIPGVSGGTMAVLMGVYDRHLDHMNNLRKQFVKNFLPLIPLLLGLILGMVPAFIFFKEAFEGFVFGIVSLFAGFILGGMPGLTDEIKGKPFKKRYLFIFLAALLIAIGFGVASMLLGENTSLMSAFNMDAQGEWIEGGHIAWWLYILLIPMGVVTATALIVPGISGSLIMLICGLYTPFLKTIDWIKNILTGQWNTEQFFSMGGLYLALVVGIIIGLLTIFKLMKLLLSKYKTATYYGIIGFVLGSFVSLYITAEMITYYKNWSTNEFATWMPMAAEIPVAIVLFVTGAILSYLLVRYSRKQKALEVDKENIDQ